MKQAVFSPCEIWMVAGSNLPGKHTVSFFSSLKHRLWPIFEFSKQFPKETGCLALLAGNLYDITVSPYQGKQSMVVNNQKTHYPDIISH